MYRHGLVDSGHSDNVDRDSLAHFNEVPGSCIILTVIIPIVSKILGLCFALTEGIDHNVKQLGLYGNSVLCNASDIFIRSRCRYSQRVASGLLRCLAQKDSVLEPSKSDLASLVNGKIARLRLGHGLAVLVIKLVAVVFDYHVVSGKNSRDRSLVVSYLYIVLVAVVVEIYS